MFLLLLLFSAFYIKNLIDEIQYLDKQIAQGFPGMSINSDITSRFNQCTYTYSFNVFKVSYAHQIYSKNLLWNITN